MGKNSGRYMKKKSWMKSQWKSEAKPYRGKCIFSLNFIFIFNVVQLIIRKYALSHTF